MAAPDRLDILRHDRQIRLAPIGVDADDHLAAAGQTQLIEARAAQLKRLGGRRLLQRQRTVAIRIDDLDAPAAIDALLVGGPQFGQRVDLARADVPARAGQIARTLLDERDEHRMERQVVGQVVQAGGQQEDASFADFLVQQDRACDRSGGRRRVHWRHRRAPRSRTSRPTNRRPCRSTACDASVFPHSQKSLVTARHLARVVVDALDGVVRRSERGRGPPPTCPGPSIRCRRRGRISAPRLQTTPAAPRRWTRR